LLTFSARFAVTATATAAPTTPATTAKVTVTAWFATLALALVAFALLAFGARAAIFTLVTALITMTTATAMAASATTAMPMLVPATIVAARLFAAGRRARRRLSGLTAAEQAFQPADKAARFFCRGGLRRAFLVRLIGPRLEPSFVPTRLARITLFARLTGITRITWLARLTRVAWLTRFSRITRFARIEGALFAAFTTVAFATIGTECRAFLAAAFGLRGRFARGRRAGISRFPAHGSTLGLFGRKDLQLGFVGRFAGGRGRHAGRRRRSDRSHRSGRDRSGRWDWSCWGWGRGGL
jgi:hypothetical protein